MQHGRCKVSRACVGLRAEADDYAFEDREDGVEKPIKGNDHRLDAWRYAAMARTWDPVVEMEAPRHQLGYVQDVEGSWSPPVPEVGPLGEFS